MDVAKTQMDQQQQQQRIVADETKPQVAVKGGDSPPEDQMKKVQCPSIPWIGTKANPLGIGELQPPSQKGKIIWRVTAESGLKTSQLAIAGD